MTQNLAEKLFGERARAADNFIENYLEKRLLKDAPGLVKLKEAMAYSANSGGKRFRPVLSIMTAEALGVDPKFVLPFGSAVEFIHTYSLIHDDLPCMDNDDMRRGKPTNHKVYGEATALLAGDALLTEAFYLVTQNYVTLGELAAKAAAELSQSAGACGMVGGQSIDMYAKREDLSQDELIRLHNLKTGELIKVAALGAAILCGANQKQQKEIHEYALILGLAFQVKDDILDFNPQKPESGSFASLIGLEETKNYLNALTESSQQSIKSWDSKANPLRELAVYNRDRDK